MQLKCQVFLMLSIPVFVMIIQQFLSALFLYLYSQKIIKDFSTNLYIDQQQQTKLLMSAFTFEFNKIFQGFSQNLQIINNFEAKLLAGNVTTNSNYKQAALNNEMLYAEVSQYQQLIDIYKKNSIGVSIWIHPNISDFTKLSANAKSQVQNSGYQDFLWRTFLYSNRNDKRVRSVPIKDIYQGFLREGMLYSTGSNTTFKNYQVPANCNFTGVYKFDVRCRQWFQQPLLRAGITPIEPIMFYSQANSPFLATNLCQRQMTKQKRQNQEFWRPYSVDCLNFKLSTLYQFFDEATFESSKTIMIDPRSEKLVYNSLEQFQNKETNLQNAAEDLFPEDKSKQDKFLQVLRDYLDQIYNRDRTIVPQRLNWGRYRNSSNNQGNGQFQRIPIIGINNTQYEYYVERVNQTELIDLISDYDSVKFFEFDAGGGDPIFVTLNPIVIIEKLGPIQRQQYNSSNRTGYDIQDLFLVINILPKSYLTEWTDYLKTEINYFFLGYGIGTICLCLIFIISSVIISYRVALMVETPLIHMTSLLKKLEKGGSQIALDLIDDTIQIPEEQIFLSEDSVILFESFKSMFKMLHFVTQDIFHVEESQSLLCLNYQISFFKQFNNYRVLGICYNNMGNIHFLNERYIEAMEYYHQAVICGQYELGMYKEKDNQDLQIKDQNQKSQKINQQKYFYKKRSAIKEKISQLWIALNNFLKRKKRRTSVGINNNSLQTTSPFIQHKFNHEGKKSFVLETNNEELELQQQTDEDGHIDAINDIIFDRKFNFLKALFLKNQQINNKQVGITTLWEEYEICLLNLLNFNDKLKSISYGRTILLTTQLSHSQLSMNDHKKAIFYQKQAIKAYNDALVMESLVKKHTKQNGKRGSDNISYIGGHLRLDQSEQEDQKSENKENNQASNISSQRNINNNLKNSEQYGSPIGGQYDYENMNQIIENALKNPNEEVSIDNLLRKRYSNAHSNHDSDNTWRNSHFSKLSLKDQIITQNFGNSKNQDEDDQIKNTSDQNKIKNDNQMSKPEETLQIDMNDINQNGDTYGITSPKGDDAQQFVRDKLNSEPSLFQRKQRKSKNLQYGNKQFNQDGHSKQNRERVYSSNKCQTSRNNHALSISRRINNSFCAQKSNMQNGQISQRNSLIPLKQNSSFNQNSMNQYQLQAANIMNQLYLTHDVNNKTNNDTQQLNHLHNSIYTHQINNNTNRKKQKFNSIDHTNTLPSQFPKNNNQFQHIIDINHKRSSVQVRNHANTTQHYQKDFSQQNQKDSYNRPRCNYQLNQLPVIQQIQNGKFSQVLNNNQITQNGITLDTSHKPFHSHQSILSSLNNNQKQNILQANKYKECNIYDDIASFSSQLQHHEVLKKQRIKKKNLKLMSKINKNLEENDGKKISKYQLPCNILLYFVGLQEARILIFEKQYQSAAFLLTELLENVKYYLPYYRLQCLKLIEQIFSQNFVKSIKLKGIIKRFDESISFKVISIIAVNTAYSDSAKTCQHLMKEVLTKDQDLYSIIIYNHFILKQVMPPTLMKQIRSANAYFETLLNYISGDANSVDISSCSSIQDLKFQDTSIQSNQSYQLNDNAPNSSFIQTLNNNHANQMITEPNEHQIFSPSNETKPLFTGQSNSEFQLILQQNTLSSQQTLNELMQFNKAKENQTYLGLEQDQYEILQLKQLNMFPIKECSKEINLIESNFVVESNRFTPTNESKFYMQSVQTLPFNGNSLNIINSPLKQHLQASQFQQKENQKQVQRQQSKSLQEKLSSYETKNSISLNENSSINKSNKKLKRNRSKSFPSISNFPKTIINHKAQSQNQIEQIQLNSIKKSKTIILRKANDVKKLSLIFRQLHSDKQINEEQNGQLELNLVKKISDYTITSNQNNTTIFNPKIQKKDKMNSNNCQEINEEDEEDKNKSINLQNSYTPNKRSSFAKNEEQNKINSAPIQKISNQIHSTQINSDQLQEHKTNLLTEQDDEQLETSIAINEKNNLLSVESLNRLSSKRDINEDSVLSEKSAAFSQKAEEQQQPLNMNEQNINLVLHMAVRRALLSFFEDDNDRLQIQKLLSNHQIINKCKKFIVFITDQKGITENKAYFMLTQLLYQTQTQLLVLQLDPDESLQETNKVNDLMIQDKSIIKYFYTQEKLLQYIRNKREPMNNFGMPVMIEHFQ